MLIAKLSATKRGCCGANRSAHDFVAASSDRLADLGLGVAVDAGGVEQRDAEIERAIYATTLPLPCEFPD